MSVYEESQGSIALTNAGFSENVKFIREIYNERQAFLFDITLKVHDVIKKNPKLVKKSDSNDNKSCIIFSKHSFVHTSHRNPYTGFRSGLNNDNYSFTKELNYEEKSRIIESIFRSKSGSACKPRKSDFAILGRLEKGLLEIEVDSNTIVTLDKNNMRIKVRVEEGNHAVDSAYETFIVGSLFSFWDKKYKWRRSEGGVIYYERDRDENFGGMSTSNGEFFGPVAQRLRDAEFKAMAQLYKR